MSSRMTEVDSCAFQRCRDGSVLVRVHSYDRNDRPLPDAVFTFRPGEPQYNYWSQRADEQLDAAAEDSSLGDVVVGRSKSVV